MGYNTDWNGQLNLSRKLTDKEQEEWDTIQNERHDSEYEYGNKNREYPSIWCGFEVNEGDVFEWDTNEKTYMGQEWIRFFVNKVIEWNKEKEIIVEGEMEWRGQDMGDNGKVKVKYNSGSKMYQIDTYEIDFVRTERQLINN
tara:strand:+ start:1833 stop:2258 length:426 start_codon:yes stop_codon:yes gene_type:complete